MSNKVATYARVSSTEQSGKTQTEKHNGILYFDEISGAVEFKERPKAKKLLKDIEAKKIDTVYVKAIDRLGRNTLDVLQTIQHFTENGVNLISEREGLQTLTSEGKENPTAKLIINILASVAEIERNNIKERQMEGIAIAKLEGRYKGREGRKPLTTNQLLKKYSAVVKEIKAGQGIRRTARLCKVSIGTVMKVDKALKLS